MIRALTDADLAAARAFLEAHADTSLFLLGNLATLGPKLGEDPRSGNFKLVEEEGRIVAVFCLTRMGNLLVQAGGRTALAGDILRSVRDEPMEVCGVAGEWPLAQGVWQQLLTEPGFVPLHDAREVLYVLDPLPPRTPSLIVQARSLRPDEFLAWDALNSAFCAELSLPREATLEVRQARFAADVQQGRWWGACEGTELRAIAALNAVYGAMGQVGGVYTPAGHRRGGLARATMCKLIADAAQIHHLSRLILFTGEDNRAARALYESLGFREQGAFGLLLGRRRTAEGD
jgi:predicted GNAT family acetyltransferase